MCLCLALVGCGGGDSGGGRVDPDAIRVASFDFTESHVVAELYAQVLERAGIPVVRHMRLGSRESVEPALEQDVVDLVPEYTGTALTFLDRGGRRATADADSTYRLLKEAFAARGVIVLARSPASNQNALAVTSATAARLHLSQISNLEAVAPTLTFGGPPECQQRQFCLPGFEAVYGLRFKAFRPLDAAGPLTVAALQGNEVDVALLFTTTPQVASENFVLLEDDRGLQPADNVVPVVRRAVVDRYGDRVAAALDPISTRLTSDDLRSLNGQVDVDGRTPAQAARAWLDAQANRP
jgi:osmoprotectant transport system substrate-binding protein